MELHEFYQHHGLIANARPFDNSDDAKSDTVLAEIIDISRHQDWSRFFGEASVPSTSIIFGKRGTGKTALRLQMKLAVEHYNEGRTNDRVLVIDYADFAPFLSAFQAHVESKNRGFFGKRKDSDADTLFSYWKMPDHLDAILSLAVTQYVTEIVNDNKITRNIFPIAQRQSLLYLALNYDQIIRSGQTERLKKLADKLGFYTFTNVLSRKWDALFRLANFPIGIFDIIGIITAGLLTYYAVNSENYWNWWLSGAVIALLAGHFPGWLKRLRCRNTARQCLDANAVLPASAAELEVLSNALCSLTGQDFLSFTPPLRTGNSDTDTARMEDNRYAFIKDFQKIIACTGYTGILVIIDQIDEPSLMHGDPKRMWAFIRSLLDNKLMQHPGMGIKFLLLEELYNRYEKEEDDFRSKARLDKQNMVKSLRWTGANLIDLANRRLAACSVDPKHPVHIEAFFDEDLHSRLLNEFARWQSPRNLFKFLDTVIKIHTGKYPSSSPVWTINDATFEAAVTSCKVE